MDPLNLVSDATGFITAMLTPFLGRYPHLIATWPWNPQGEVHPITDLARALQPVVNITAEFPLRCVRLWLLCCNVYIGGNVTDLPEI